MLRNTKCNINATNQAAFQIAPERAAALLLALRALAAEDPSRPQTHIALAGILETAASVVAEAESNWNASPGDAAHARWLRDRELLNVASSARTKRTESAWRSLTGTSGN